MDIKDEQYLTVKELSEKIKYSQQTIYNRIHDGIFIRGDHYIKPSRKKVLFLWSAVCKWLESIEASSVKTQKLAKKSNAKTPVLSSTDSNKGIINI